MLRAECESFSSGFLYVVALALENLVLFFRAYPEVSETLTATLLEQRATKLRLADRGYVNRRGFSKPF